LVKELGVKIHSMNLGPQGVWMGELPAQATVHLSDAASVS
jgi:hypothetical protein